MVRVKKKYLLKILKEINSQKCTGLSKLFLFLNAKSSCDDEIKFANTFTYLKRMISLIHLSPNIFQNHIHIATA